MSDQSHNGPTVAGPFFTPEGARAYLGGVGKTKYYELIAAGTLRKPRVRLSERKKLHPKSDLDEAASSCLVEEV
jgi:hypothetical protein